MWGIPPLFSSPLFRVCLRVWTWGQDKLHTPEGTLQLKGAKKIP